MPVMVPKVTCGGSWRCAQQVIENVNNGTYITLRTPVSVLESWVQGSAERARIHTLSVVMHTLYDCTLPASCVLLRGELL